MSELATIEKTKTLLTKNKLINDFTALGVKNGDNIIVHLSLSSIGWIVGGSRTFLEALLEVIGSEGTLVMAAHTNENSNPDEWCNPPVPKEWIETIKAEMPAFDVNNSPVRGIGTTPETFRHFKGVSRSDHPQGSFAALGKHQIEITKHHVLTPQFGMETPLGVLYNLDAKILLVGVDYTTCTSLHLAEVIAEINPLVDYETAMFVDGVRKWVKFEDFYYDVSAFNTIGENYEKSTNNLLQGYVGMAKSKLIPMRNLVDFAVLVYKTTKSDIKN